MVLYIPSDDFPKIGMADGGAARDAHLEAFRKYGPPPPNYRLDRLKVTRNNAFGKVVTTPHVHYQEISSTQGDFIHPLSPEGLQRNSNPIIHDEFDLNRQNCLGIVDVPFKYKTSTQIKWRYFDTWTKALAAALAAQKQPSKSDKSQLVTNADVQATSQKLNPKDLADPRNHELYHPADRSSLVFKDEPTVAMVARAYGASLIIVCPFVNKDKSGFNRIYNIQNRPPIYARWSTGWQAVNPPVVLGCLPVQNHTRKSLVMPYDVMWFFLDADMGKEPAWHIGFYRNFDVKAMAINMGFPVEDLPLEVFLWCLVNLHRRRLLGYNIPDQHLGCWIWQFSNHLVTNCKPLKNPHPVPFRYDGNKIWDYKAKYPKLGTFLTYERLTMLILNPHMRIGTSVSIIQYAHRWNEAIEAQIHYQLDKTDANWLSFKAKMEAARKLPF